MTTVDDHLPSSSQKELLGEAEPLAPCLIHEMRHPLMGALAAVRFLESSLGAAVAGSEDWELLKGQLARMNELFATYQTFFHPEQRAPTHFAVQPVVSQAVALLGYRLRRCGERFHLQMPTEPLEVQGVPDGLLHALTNLLLNSLDALEETGAPGRLEVRALRGPEGRVQIRVSDEGSGISAEARAHVFERGFTTKPAGKGTGLGLVVAQRMVVAHGGRLTLVPPEDPLRLAWARTEFCVDLPPAPPADEQPAPEKAPAAARAPAPAAARAPARILAVDDAAIIVLLLRKALKLAGHEGVVVSSAAEAARLLETESFELLITDKNLPGSTGMELAALARRRNPAMGVILITAYASLDSATSLLALGIDDYLTKPFEIDALTERIDQVLAARRAGPSGRAVTAPARGARVVLVEHDAAFRSRIAQELQRLGCQEVVHDDLLGGLRSLPPPDAVIAPAALFGPEARQELAIGEPTSLSDTIAAIGIGALASISRTLDGAALAAALAAALGDRRAS